MNSPNLIHIQTKDNLVILTHKIDTLITLTTFLKKCEEKKQRGFTYRDGGSSTECSLIDVKKKKV